MMATYNIEEQVIARAMAEYPNISELVKGSTPVVSFGYPAPAKVVTIGINPSSNEFQKSGKSKDLLTLPKKRLIDSEILGIPSSQQLTREQAIAVIEGCYDYFNKREHNPYMTWFKHLNENINKHFGADYLDGSAVHLDLVQWATDPVWGNIKSKSVRSDLLAADAEFLRYQLSAKRYDIVFMNGSQVTEQLISTKIVELSLTKEFTYKTKNGKSKKLEFYKGNTANGSLALGWSRTFPGHYISADALPAVIEEFHRFMDQQTKEL